ncbi:hypothetical protein ACQFYA_14165 [Promicromonospora sp. Marseille-Q5078]
MTDGADLSYEVTRSAGRRRQRRVAGLVTATLLVVGALALVPFVLLPHMAVWIYALACGALLVVAGFLPKRSVWRVLCVVVAVGIALIVGPYVLADVLSFVPDATVDG